MIHTNSEVDVGIEGLQSISYKLTVGRGAIIIEDEPMLFKVLLGLTAVTTMCLMSPFAAWQVTFEVSSIAP